MDSMAFSRLISVKDMESLVGQGMTYEQIVANLEWNIPQVMGYLGWVFGDFAKIMILKETVT